LTPALGKVGVGVIGTGFVADLHLAAFARNSNATVLAVAGRSSEKAARLAAENGIADSYGDFRSLLEPDDIDMAPELRDEAVLVLLLGQALPADQTELR